jgi:hypothetical protein
MSYKTVLTILISTSLLCLTACKDKGSSDVRDRARSALGNPQPATDNAAQAGTATLVSHYYCPNNCEGSGADAAGNCPVCGTQLLHNSAFHNQTPTTPNPANDPTYVIDDDPQQALQQMLQQAQGAQGGQPTATGVSHYICPNNCEGSGGAVAGNCPVCGTAYVHNQAFHSQASGITPPAAAPGQQALPATPPAAQNAAGEYHYICPNGHEGGAATASGCPTCGAELVHNQAYHN